MYKHNLNRTPQFSVGHQMFFNGQLDNPYPKNSVAYKEWEAGFNYAYLVNQEKVRNEEASRSN